ncbi:hypothetical protein C6A85_14580, partial [Mycobacterium sp. ITM-2017-0098]
QLLVEVAGRLLAAVDENDLVARWGGDEFLIITDTVEEHGLARRCSYMAWSAWSRTASTERPSPGRCVA